MIALPTLDLSILSVSFVLTVMLTEKCREFLLKRSMLDCPNERSSHTTPVPRGGGWALMAVLIPGILVTGLLQKNLTHIVPLLISLALLILVSWQDDRKSISALMRLGVHLLAATIGSLIFVPTETLFGNLLPFWLDRAVMIIGWAWFMNLYNFMDGIDGITSCETIAIAAGICLVMMIFGMNDPFVSTLTLILTGVCLGFLVFNWYPAKIFLGDVGSVPLGFITGYMLLAIAMKGFLIPALILPLYYLADSGITIIKRALRREKIWQAHRQHFYQKAAAAMGRHNRVVGWIIVANIGLIAASILSVACPFYGLSAAIVLVALLLGKMHKTTL